VNIWQRTIIFLSPAATRRSSDAPGNVANQLTNTAYKALVASVQVDRFRFLIRWFVCMYVGLSVIEHPTFRELVVYCCPAIEPFLVKSGATIRRWIFMEFKRQRIRVKDELAQAQSLAHNSFDLWTSLNLLGMVAVVACFLDRDLRNQSLLIGMRRMRESRSGENIAEVFIPILVEMEIIGKLGYFTMDNALPTMLPQSTSYKLFALTSPALVRASTLSGRCFYPEPSLLS
jgi:hypothetical protein